MAMGGDGTSVTTDGATDISLATVPGDVADSHGQPYAWQYASSLLVTAGSGTLVLVFAEGGGRSRSFSVSPGWRKDWRTTRILAASTSGISIDVEFGGRTVRDGD